MNLVLSDGQRMVTTRYVSGGEKSNSLYIITGSRFCSEGGQSHMNEGDDAVLVVSEPLNDSSRWQKIANNHIITIDRDKKISDHKM